MSKECVFVTATGPGLGLGLRDDVERKILAHISFCANDDLENAGEPFPYGTRMVLVGGSAAQTLVHACDF